MTHTSPRGPVGVATVAAVAAIVLGWAAWAAWAGRVADGVSATWDLRCADTTVGRFRGSPAIRSHPGWECDVRLHVVNGSTRPVHLLRVEAELMGTRGRAEVQGLPSRDASIRDAAANARDARFGDADAVWQVERVIPAQSSATVDLAIGWRDTGCNSAGHLYIERWPTIVFETLRRTYRYSPQQRLVLRTYDDPHDAAACPP